jgi:hypothetical protein
MPTHLRISLGTEEQMARFQPVLTVFNEFCRRCGARRCAVGLAATA